eukprot:TRINITY_DN7732_c0_g1_i1.p1 TRINITY_DN7732_c0_g1~~TRINITY_DN7732_c0_g1_i1.p1  ORF type:complete len:769 (-),score=146.49 TRINITY_DN7732_c0_g1_i1:176-2482(-)
MPLITRQGGGDFTTDPAIATRTGTHGTPLGPGSYSVCKTYDAEEGLRATTLSWHANTQKRMPTTDFHYDLRTELHESPPQLARTTPAGMSFNASKSSFSATGNRLGAWIYGGTFVASTTKDNPAPGTYKPKVDHRCIPDTFHGDSKAEHEKMAVPLLGSSQSAPTIPQQRDASKFRYTGRKTDTLAPCDYEQDGIANPCTVVRKGVRSTDFAASESERRLLPPPTSIDYTLPSPDNPDPGEYKVRSKLTRGTEAGFRSTMPRIAYARDEGLPGPGHYPTKGMAGTWPPPAEGPEPDPPKMGSGMASTTSRSPPSWWRPDGRGPPLITPDYLKMPGPGAFHDPKAFGKSARKLRHRCRSSGDEVVGRMFHAVHEPNLISNLRRSNGAQVCGFNSTSVRDAAKPIKKDPNCGPGDYDLDAAMGQSIMAKVRSREGVGKKGAFGSCADRYEGSAFKVKNDNPAPGSYSLDQQQSSTPIQGVATQKGMSTFRSQEEQRPVQKKTGNVHTGPGQYEQIAFPGKINYRSKVNPGKTEHVAFGMSHDRWDPNAYNTIGPDPGNYTLPSSLGSKGLAISTDSKTAKTRVDNDVGPGTYEVRKSLLKGTFNVAHKAHARKAITNADSLDLPIAGGGAGGGMAALQARMNRVDGGAAHQEESPTRKPPPPRTQTIPARPGGPRPAQGAAADSPAEAAPPAAPVDETGAAAQAAAAPSPAVAAPAAAEAPAAPVPAADAAAAAAATEDAAPPAAPPEAPAAPQETAAPEAAAAAEAAPA